MNLIYIFEPENTLHLKSVLASHGCLPSPRNSSLTAMVQLKQITRNATFAWAPAEGKPLIASGTIAGAVDASFSQDSELEIWDLNLDNSDTSAFELKPTAKVSTERK